MSFKFSFGVSYEEFQKNAQDTYNSKVAPLLLKDMRAKRKSASSSKPAELNDAQKAYLNCHGPI